MSKWKDIFRWRTGRQDTGYSKMLLWQQHWPIGLDAYLIYYPDGTELPEHTDPVQKGKHYRLNIILKQPLSGLFYAKECIFETARIKFFRPDIAPHGITKTSGSRLVFSVGWVKL